MQLLYKKKFRKSLSSGKRSITLIIFGWNHGNWERKRRATTEILAGSIVLCPWTWNGRIAEKERVKNEMK